MKDANSKGIWKRLLIFSEGTKPTTTITKHYNTKGWNSWNRNAGLRITRESPVSNHITEVTKEFRSVQVDHKRDIDVNKLISAMKHFLVVMEAIGMRRAAQEIHSNLLKVEKSLETMPCQNRRTLSTVLLFEKQRGIHLPGGRLHDPSAAMGLLWIRRSLSFQCHMYSLVLKGVLPAKAAVSAYHHELEPYHGTLLKKLYRSVLVVSSPRSKEEMIQKMAGPSIEDDNKLGEDLRTLLKVWNPLLSSWKHIFITLDLEDSRQV